MLARNYKDVKVMEYPVYVQPKLDGLRCLAYLDKNPDEHSVYYHDVVLYSRQKKEYPENASTEAIKKSLLNILKDNYDEKNEESLYLDGELYKHGKSLQKLSSATRGTVKASKDTEEYHVYDMFYPSYDKNPFSERTESLKQIYNTLDDETKKSVKLVPTHIAQNKADNDKLYHKYLDDNYEGIMLRNPAGKYAKSATKKSSALRSKDLLKRKEVFDDEFEVVAFTQGNMGKDVGALIWICCTADNSEFNVVPNMPLEERYTLFKDCKKNFENKYNGRMLTVEYRALSLDNVPQHAKGIIFRNE
jgi:ATP-dependent DNA ligase